MVKTLPWFISVGDIQRLLGLLSAPGRGGGGGGGARGGGGSAHGPPAPGRLSAPRTGTLRTSGTAPLPACSSVHSSAGTGAFQFILKQL